MHACRLKGEAYLPIAYKRDRACYRYGTKLGVGKSNIRGRVMSGVNVLINGGEGLLKALRVCCFPPLVSQVHSERWIDHRFL